MFLNVLQVPSISFSNVSLSLSIIKQIKAHLVCIPPASSLALHHKETNVASGRNSLQKERIWNLLHCEWNTGCKRTWPQGNSACWCWWWRADVSWSWRVCCSQCERSPHPTHGESLCGGGLALKDRKMWLWSRPGPVFLPFPSQGKSHKPRGQLDLLNLNSRMTRTVTPILPAWKIIRAKARFPIPIPVSEMPQISMCRQTFCPLQIHRVTGDIRWVKVPK